MRDPNSEKSETGPYLLNRTEDFDEISHTHWYWQDLAQETVKYHFTLVKALPKSKLWKRENCPKLVHWQDLTEGIAKFYRSWIFRGPTSEKGKLALSLEPYGRFWWNFENGWRSDQNAFYGLWLSVVCWFETWHSWQSQPNYMKKTIAVNCCV